MVMEAVYTRVIVEDAKAEKEAALEAKRKEFKQDFSELEEYR